MVHHFLLGLFSHTLRHLHFVIVACRMKVTNATTFSSVQFQPRGIKNYSNSQ